MMITSEKQSHHHLFPCCQESRLQGLQVRKKPYLTVEGWDRRPKYFRPTDDPVWILSSPIPTDSLEERWGREGKTKNARYRLREGEERHELTSISSSEGIMMTIFRERWSEAGGKNWKPSGKGKKSFFQDSWLDILPSRMRDESRVLSDSDRGCRWG